LCRRAYGRREKIQQYRGLKSGTALAMSFSGSSSDFRLRASATSRIAHASVTASHASASKPADGGTPFELLLASVSPKAAKPTQAGTKDDAGSAHAKDDKHPDTVSDAAGTHDIATPTKADTKTAKSDTDAADAAKDDKTDATADTGAAPVADAAAPAPDMAMMQAPAPQLSPQQPTDTDQGGDVAALQGAAASQAGAPRDAAPQADDTAAAASAKPGTAGKPAIADAKTDAASKGAARKTTATDAKTDAADDLKADAAKAAAPQVASDAPAKPAPQTAGQAASQANANVALTAPQGATPASAASAPAVAQHVQVSAEQPQPNVPALAVQIAVRSQSGARQFDIRLDPPELGHVEVRLSIDATGKASAHLSADQPQTLDLLQKDSTSLTRALREAGLDVSQDGLNFSLRQQGQQAGQDSGGGPAFSRRGALSLSASSSIDATTTSATWRSPADGRLDIRV
jgi:flagellar hook-length control protein FliK